MVPKDAPRPDIATRALADLLRDIVANGRKPIETPDISDTVAVHDLRKAFKRWRALMRLIAPTVGDEAEEMRIAARDLAREIAAARDIRAAQEALADLGDDTPALTARSRAAIGERLAQLGASAEAIGLTPERKARIGEMWTLAAAAVERWPLQSFDRAEAAQQLAASYRRVCAAIPEDWSEVSPDALHRLRQRVVEHRYQMELAEPLWPKLMRLWVSEAQRLRDRLGAHQDLVILERLTQPNQPLARWRSQLAPLIVERRAAHVKGANRLAGRLFAEKSKAFRQRLASLWEHRAHQRD
ncbi:MAG TPA: CHAD domain-containing protein [Xanthobacteraceae bacterium]|jgi:CHAD domain-containing protein|nr:CHAD domain-containing protein [Xanthobacteraceae bacterium]